MVLECVDRAEIVDYLDVKASMSPDNYLEKDR